MAKVNFLEGSKLKLKEKELMVKLAKCIIECWGKNRLSKQEANSTINALNTLLRNFMEANGTTVLENTKCLNIDQI